MYKKNSQSWVKHLDFMMLDLVCLQFAYIIAYLLRHGWQNPYASNVYCSMLLLLSVADVMLAILLDTFKNVLKRGFYKEFLMTARQVSLIVLLATFYLFSIQRGEAISRTVLYLMGCCYGLLSYISRLLWKSYLRKRLRELGRRSLLIVTTSDRAADVLEKIKYNNFEMFCIPGIVIVDGAQMPAFLEGIPVMSNQRDSIEQIRRGWVDEAFIDIAQGAEAPQELLDQLLEMGVVIHINLEGFFGLPHQKQFTERIGQYTVLTSSINYTTTGNLWAKRLMDILGGLAGCVITILLTVILGPIIKFHSPGPIFFAQTRVGKNGRQFKMYKFRSMYPDAEERKEALLKENRMGGQQMFKLEYDPRIIGCRKLPDGRIKKGIGNYIRDFSLDEFPQFWNVLKGDMSLVGTRPPTVDEWEKYDSRHRVRLVIKPGITGLWQVSGRSNITDFEEVVKLDAQYIMDWNIGMDIKICLKTLKVMFSRDGAM